MGLSSVHRRRHDHGKALAACRRALALTGRGRHPLLHPTASAILITLRPAVRAGVALVDA